MRFLRATTILLVLAIVLIHAAAFERDDLKGEYNAKRGYRGPKMSAARGRGKAKKSKAKRVVLEHGKSKDVCFHYPPEMPHCVYSLKTPECSRSVHRSYSRQNDCPCGLGLPAKLTDCHCVTKCEGEHYPVVQKIVDRYNNDDDFQNDFDAAIEELVSLNVEQAKCITTASEYFCFADQILKTPPYQQGDSRNVYDILAVFYLVINMKTLQKYQSPITPGTTEHGTTQQQLLYLSGWSREFSIAWGDWLDTKRSTDCLDTFEKDEWYCWNDFVVPEDDFKTYNEYFSRHLRNPDITRPLNGTGNSSIVVFPADSTPAAIYKISGESEIDTTTDPIQSICAKGAVWSIHELLFLSKYQDYFQNGVFFHAFLSTYNYHRWHSPVAGTIMERRVISGQFHLNVSVIDYEGDNVPYLRDDTGYQFVQQRGKDPFVNNNLQHCYVGLIVIKASDPNIGYVAALPIGMAQVSGINFTVEVGETVEKGQELGTFLFGGSDFVLVFQKCANFYLTAEMNVQYYVRQQVGTFDNPICSTTNIEHSHDEAPDEDGFPIT